jgi:hypothetical protein
MCQWRRFLKDDASFQPTAHEGGPYVARPTLRTSRKRP